MQMVVVVVVVELQQHPGSSSVDVSPARQPILSRMPHRPSSNRLILSRRRFRRGGDPLAQTRPIASPQQHRAAPGTTPDAATSLIRRWRCRFAVGSGSLLVELTVLPQLRLHRGVSGGHLRKDHRLMVGHSDEGAATHIFRLRHSHFPGPLVLRSVAGRWRRCRWRRGCQWRRCLSRCSVRDGL